MCTDNYKAEIANNHTSMNYKGQRNMTKKNFNKFNQLNLSVIF